MKSEGDTWPPQVWTETHDLLTGITRISWIGDDASQYPWGRMKDHEQMTYVLGDDQPEKSSIHAEGSTTIELPGRTLVWSVVIDLSSDLQQFLLPFRAPSHREWQTDSRKKAGTTRFREIINSIAARNRIPEYVLKNSAILLISCPDQKGLNAAVHEFIYRANGNTLHADEHQDYERNLFLMRVEWDLAGFSIDMRDFAKEFQPVADRFGMKWRVALSNYRPKVAIFVSRYDHCLSRPALSPAQRGTRLRDSTRHQQSRRRAPLDGLLQNSAARDPGDQRK